MSRVGVCVLGALVCCCASVPAADDPAKPPPGVTGVVKKHDRFPSRFVAPRNVHVWLPPSYATATETRYPVLYMHDGQNLFDPKTSFLGVDWGVDEAMTRLVGEKKIPEALVVGIWNTPRRVQEYLPAKLLTDGKKYKQYAALEKDLARFRMGGTDPKGWLADLYLKFLVEDLKPFIDKEYRTKPGRADTSVMGSSAGALISLYAVCEYPDVFGGAGCVSTHWPLGDGILVDFFADRLPDPATHRIYYDFGTETLDQGYEPFQNRMDEVMKKKGWTSGRNWLTRKFPGADHSERSWRKRVDVPLEFLLREAP
jgi:predicted alpha/beta superfamily hydrolase